MKKKILAHFQKVDPILFEAAKKIGIIEPVKSDNLFYDICEAIITQQLSEKAAETIFNRFKKLFRQQKITAKAVLKISDQSIRQCGTSWAKVRFIKDLAQKVERGELRLEKLKKLDDKEVVKELTKVKGIGPWTAEMILMFSLTRPDVFSHGDLGLKKAIKKLYQFKKEPTQKQIEKIVEKWSPYKTYACRILWRTLQ